MTCGLLTKNEDPLQQQMPYNRDVTISCAQIVVNQKPGFCTFSMIILHFPTLILAGIIPIGKNVSNSDLYLFIIFTIVTVWLEFKLHKLIKFTLLLS